MSREALKRFVLKHGTWTTPAGVRGNPDGWLKLGYANSVTWIRLGDLELGRGPGARLFFNKIYHPKLGYRSRRFLLWRKDPMGLELTGRAPWPK